VGLMMTQQKFHFIPLPSVYFIPYLPVKLMLNDVILITVTGLIFIFLGTLYPAYRVSKLMPLEAIRYEK
jgi:lipoprotein-releasing system permease protein